jgi:Protein of unknown function (DUF2630)
VTVGGNMSAAQSDSSVLGRIDSLVQEEERLYAKTQLSEEDGKRLGELKVELDQCWDLLRQRRALREFGKDPETAKGSLRRNRRKLRAVARLVITDL